jgi:hypothetical protein
VTAAMESVRPDGRATPSRVAGGVLGDLSAALVVLAAVPLALLQIPNLIAAAEPAMLASVASGSRYEAALIRAAGLALPAMLLAAPVAALAARRGRGWRVLMAALITLAVADLGAGMPATWVETVPGITLDRAVHGLGAGAALAASLAIVWERPGPARRVLACLWSAAAVVTMTAAVPLVGSRVAAGGWRAVLQPYPWLTGVTLAITAAHVLVTRGGGAARGGPRGRSGAAAAGRDAGGWGAAGRDAGGWGAGGRDAGGWGAGGRDAAGRAGRRGGLAVSARGVITPAERAQLALLFVPAAGLCALAVGSTFQWPPAGQVAAGGVAAVVLTTLAIVLSRDPSVGSVPALPFCALLAGLVMAPSAGAIEGVRLLRAGQAAAAAAAVGAAGTPTARPPGPALAWPGGPAVSAIGGVPALPVAAAVAGAVIAAAFAAGAAKVALRRRAGSHGGRAGGQGGGRAGGQGGPAAPLGPANTAAAAGLAVSACGLALARAAGTFVPARMQLLALALLAGGVALALGAALADAPAGAALAALPLALAGMVTGYLVAGGMQIWLVIAGSPGHGLPAVPPAIPDALLRATAMWELAAAAAAGLGAIMVLLAGRACRAGVSTPSSG